MPRAFGQLDADAWRNDPDWRTLPTDAQWLFGLLVSQGELSAAGTLTLAVGRWQRMSGDMTPERFAEALAALEARRYVLVDFDELEILVRTYARRKTQWSNPKRRTAVLNAAMGLHSDRLKTALAVDLAKAPASEGVDRDWVAPILAKLPPVTPRSVAEFSPEGTPESLAKTLAEVSGNRSRACAPQKPEARSQKPEAREAGTASPSASARRGTRIPEPFVITDDMRTWARTERFPDAWTDRITESFVDYWRAKPGTGGVKLDWPATWRTWLRREAERSPPQSAPTRGDDRYAGHLALIEHFDRQEGA